ncbi:hypothetical protein PVAND_014692 [Polypedilum vanderplanki]|uniref:Uncharacterized protein n=1 Tax=Polypedilum vanderplanki TaxID=319348 RepID=A0A9J6BAF9_POLVA|nr:hypothetical protein PVAND_014692 [Polypedilum vanderplanki]
MTALSELTICILLIIASIAITNAALPSTIPICRRSDPRISDCMIEAIKALQPKMADGNLGDGFRIPPQEPFYINDIALSDASNMKITLTDVALHGTTKFNIEKLRANMQELKMDAIISYPSLELTAKYHYIAQFFGRPIKSEGDIVVKIGDSRNRISIKMHKVLKDGKEYLQFDKVGIKISGQPTGIQLKGLFGDNKTLNEIATALIKENPLFQPNRLFPHFEKNLSEAMTNIANTIVYKATFDEVFPE